MAVTVFAAPILPGKTEAWKQAIAELSGPRKADFDDWNRRLGLTRHVASLQQTPDGDFAVVYAEGDDPANTIAHVLASDHPFDEWFAEKVLADVHGIHAEHGPPPQNQVFVDWSA